MSVRIRCIKKAGGQHENPYVAISDLGWVNETDGTQNASTRIQMYDFVKGGGEAVVVSGQYRVRLIAAETQRGTKYVKTVADSTLQDNLLKLPECA
jgi:uncharacterized protein DUF3892